MAPKRERPSSPKAPSVKTRKALRPQAKKHARTGKSAVPVVGIGASAGGLDALSKFFQAMPADAGIAFVVVQHLDPNHKSLMADLLAKHTAMEVVQAKDGMAVRPDHVYVIAPNTYLTIDQGALKVSEPVTVRGMRMPIDYFFRSLGEDREEKAICIVLSGTATDGTLGLRAVKSHGGLALVQDPATASHDGMPHSAISTGMVDLVLPVEEMPEAIVKYVRHPFIRDVEKAAPIPEQDQDDLQKILALLRNRAGHDFKWYKKATLVRRIQRRIGLNHLDSYAQYLDHLRNHPHEVDQLFKELLISVTDWFRDPPAWEDLKEHALPQLFEQQGRSAHPLRIWVAGCATGEEAYSLAMLLTEVAEARQVPPNFLVFATDVNRDSLEFARNGIYPDAIGDEISQERLTRFFIKEGQFFKVKKSLREAIVFAQQNLISDPPFSKLDLISCRNLLIYLEPEIQKKIISLFHFSLKQHGFLFLGNSEGVTQQKNLFEPISKKWRIYRRIGVTRTNLELPASLDEKRYQGLKAVTAARPQGRRPRLAEMAQEILLQRFVPASVLIDNSFQVLYYHGPHENYLLQPPGEPTTDLLSIAREGLRSRLRGAVHTALKKQEDISFTDGRVKRGDRFYRVKVTVTPLRDEQGAEGLLLVTFEDVKPAPKTERREEEYPKADEAVVHQLEEELRLTKEELQSTVEELETSNEELKSSNEEVMSMNEELQSANEELETSKEELQSMNEELITVNAQLEEKIKEVEATNNDLNNLLASTDIATIFLDTNLRIKRYTPATRKIFNYLPSDVGRPVTDLSHHSFDPDLPQACRQVLDHLQPDQKEVRDEEGYWYIRRTLPYRTEDNRIGGVVVTFTNVTRIKQTEEQLRKAKDLSEAVNELNEVIHSTLDFDSIMRRVTTRAIEPLGLEAFSIGLLQDDYYEFRYAYRMPENLVGRRLPRSDLKGVGLALKTKEVIVFNDTAHDKRLSAEPILEYGIRSLIIAPLIVKGKAIGTLNFYCLSAPLEFTELQKDYARKTADSLSLAIENARLFGELQKAEQSASVNERLAQRRLAELQGIYASAPVGLCFVDTDLKYVKISNKLAAMNGPTVEEHLGRTIHEVLPELADTVEPNYRRVLETGEPLEDVEFRGTRPAWAGVVRDWLASYYPVRNEEGRVLGVNAVVQDITERKGAEEALRKNEQLLRDVLRNLPVGVWIADREGKIIHGNPAGQEIWHGAEYAGPEEYHAYKAWRLNTREPVRPEEWALTRAVTKGEISLEEELEIEAFDGEHKIISNSAIPLWNEQGEIQGAIALNVDITSQKRLEQILRRSNQELEQFAYIASHDLKEPLRMVTGYLDLLQRRYQGKLDGEADEFIGFATEGASRMHELIDDLLAFSRIGTKGKPLSPVAMEEVFARAILNLKQEIEETGAIIEHEDLPEVKGDEGQLVQLLQNLLANALKFTSDGKPEVEISVKEDEEAGFYRFAVRDNGIGMEMNQSERIFTIFQRLHGRDNYPGTGIGLAICKKIIDRHGGRIWVESAPGEGSIFFFTLPKT